MPLRSPRPFQLPRLPLLLRRCARGEGGCRCDGSDASAGRHVVAAHGGAIAIRSIFAACGPESGDAGCGQQVPGSSSGVAQPLLRLQRFEVFPDRDLRRLDNRLVSVLAHGNTLNNDTMAGRPAIHFCKEMWGVQGLVPLLPASPHPPGGASG